jgi:hypothetical protein
MCTQMTVPGEMKLINTALEISHPQILASSPPAGDGATVMTRLSGRDFLLEPGGQDYVGINSYDGMPGSE